MKCRAFWLALAFAIFGTSFANPCYGIPESKRGTLQGRVYDAESGSPLPGVNIILKGTTLGTVTDRNGHFLLSRLPTGTYTVIFSMIGYKPRVFERVEIHAGKITRLDVALKQTAIEAPEVVVTATKSIQRIQDSPVSVAIISRPRLRQMNSITIQDALRYTPGIYMVADQVNVRGSTGYNKGAGSRVLLLLDGVPAIAGDTGGINWDLIPPTEIAKIEIVKGAGSALYGSNALGGVINIITRDPSPVPQTRVRLSGGFFDRPYYDSWRYTRKFQHFSAVDFTHSRKLGKVGLLISAGHKSSTGYRQNGEYSRWNIFYKMNTRPSPQSNLALLLNWSYDDHGYYVKWKGPALNHPLEVPPENLGDSIHSGKFVAHLSYKHLLTSRLALIARTSFYYNNWRNYFHDNSDYSKTGKFQQEIQIQYQAGKGHWLTGGAEWMYHTNRSSIFRPDGNKRGNPWMRDFAIYFQDEMKVAPILKVTAGLRYDRHRVWDLFTEDQWSPKLGLVVQPAPFTAVRLSVGRGFRAASIAEIFTNTVVSGFRVAPNLNLRAESSWSYEIGIRQQLSSMTVVDAALFHNLYWNLIEPKMASLIPPTFQLDNLARARISGLELSFETAFYRQRVRIQGAYTYLDASRLGEIQPIFTLDNLFYMPSRTLPYRPRHLLQLHVSYRQAKWTIGMDFRYMSRFEEVLVYPSDFRVSQKVWDAFVEFQITSRCSFLMRINNLFNYHYVEMERDLAPIRHVIFTLNWQRLRK